MKEIIKIFQIVLHADLYFVALASCFFSQYNPLLLRRDYLSRLHPMASSLIHFSLKKAFPAQLWFVQRSEQAFSISKNVQQRSEKKT